MKPSSILVMAAALMFAVAALAHIAEEPCRPALLVAYFSLSIANFGFALL